MNSVGNERRPHHFGLPYEPANANTDHKNLPLINVTLCLVGINQTLTAQIMCSHRFFVKQLDYRPSHRRRTS